MMNDIATCLTREIEISSGYAQQLTAQAMQDLGLGVTGSPSIEKEVALLERALLLKLMGVVEDVKDASQQQEIDMTFMMSGFDSLRIPSRSTSASSFQSCFRSEDSSRNMSSSFVSYSSNR